MRSDAMAGFVSANLVAHGEPYLVRPEHEQAITTPYVADGGTVVRIDAMKLQDDQDFFAALHAVAPLPYEDLSNWDAFRDLHEEIAEEWPERLMLVVANIDHLVAVNLHLALRLPHELIDARYGLAAHGCTFLPVFALGSNGID